MSPNSSLCKLENKLDEGYMKLFSLSNSRNSQYIKQRKSGNLCMYKLKPEFSFLILR